MFGENPPIINACHVVTTDTADTTSWMGTWKKGTAYNKLLLLISITTTVTTRTAVLLLLLHPATVTQLTLSSFSCNNISNQCHEKSSRKPLSIAVMELLQSTSPHSIDRLLKFEEFLVISVA